MPKLDLDAIERTDRTGYPQPYAAAMGKRLYRKLAGPAGLADFGVSHVLLQPGGISSQRHWHEGEDEFLVMLEGEAVLVEDEGETMLRPGDCAAFPKGVANGHHLVNRSARDCVFVCVGKPAVTDCHYPDIDMHLDAVTGRFTHKDGSAYVAAASPLSSASPAASASTSASASASTTRASASTEGASSAAAGDSSSAAGAISPGSALGS